tara:strand:- start:819 stop:1463 length:645 start_codon:yes stop_codon:yes gene_type:complete
MDPFERFSEYIYNCIPINLELVSLRPFKIIDISNVNYHEVIKDIKINDDIETYIIVAKFKHASKLPYDTWYAYMINAMFANGKRCIVVLPEEVNCENDEYPCIRKIPGTTQCELYNDSGIMIDKTHELCSVDDYCMQSIAYMFHIPEIMTHDKKLKRQINSLTFKYKYNGTYPMKCTHVFMYNPELAMYSYYIDGENVYNSTFSDIYNYMTTIH